jgi:hypothetical protein
LETVSSKDKIDRSVKPEFKASYKYKSGSVYTGEWVGGFRDGVGTNIYLDGAFY